MHRRAIAAVISCLVSVSFCLAGPPGAAKDGYEISVAPGRDSGIYRAGEKIAFAVSVTRDGKALKEGQVSYQIVAGGTRTLKQGTLPLAADGAKVQTELAEAGCVAMRATYKLDGNAQIRAEAGATVDPNRIRPSLPPPDDFDEFWSRQRKRLTDAPATPKLTPVQAPKVSWGPQVECFDVQVDCPGGKPLSAYFARPKDAKPGSLPAILSFHGAGVHSSSLMSTAGYAARGMLGMDVNAHGLPNGKPKDFYSALLAGELRGYPTRGMDSRDTCYLLGMYLRLMRAMEFITSQPEWDGKTLAVRGSSQGGAQAIVAAGLDARVTILSAGLPGLCDLTAGEANRAAGWPVGKRKLTGKQLGTLRYFDVCNFAARTKATAIVRVGLIDHTCWPSGVLAACNQLKGPRHILTTPNSGHSWTPREAYTKADTLFWKLLDEQRKAATPSQPAQSRDGALPAAKGGR
ncbi:MAG TPA: acetylxylan esterase [Phycisphaerae bacterium]|nr:acetylxylan esterase [Phycisphaerae bacterium]